MPLNIFTIKFIIITVLLINLYYYCPNNIINNIFIIVLSLQCSKHLSVILTREVFKTQSNIYDETFWEVFVVSIVCCNAFNQYVFYSSYPMVSSLSSTCLIIIIYITLLLTYTFYLSV